MSSIFFMVCVWSPWRPPSHRRLHRSLGSRAPSYFSNLPLPVSLSLPPLRKWVILSCVMNRFLSFNFFDKRYFEESSCRRLYMTFLLILCFVLCTRASLLRSRWVFPSAPASFSLSLFPLPPLYRSLLPLPHLPLLGSLPRLFH